MEEIKTITFEELVSGFETIVDFIVGKDGKYIISVDKDLKMGCYTVYEDSFYDDIDNLTCFDTQEEAEDFAVQLVNNYSQQENLPVLIQINRKRDKWIFNYPNILKTIPLFAYGNTVRRMAKKLRFHIIQTMAQWLR